MFNKCYLIVFRDTERRGVPGGRHQRHAVSLTDDCLQKYLPGTEYTPTLASPLLNLNICIYGEFKGSLQLF